MGARSRREPIAKARDRRRALRSALRSARSRVARRHQTCSSRDAGGSRGVRHCAPGRRGRWCGRECCSRHHATAGIRAIPPASYARGSRTWTRAPWLAGIGGACAASRAIPRLWRSRAFGRSLSRVTLCIGPRGPRVLGRARAIGGWPFAEAQSAGGDLVGGDWPAGRREDFDRRRAERESQFGCRIGNTGARTACAVQGRGRQRPGVAPASHREGRRVSDWPPARIAASSQRRHLRQPSSAAPASRSFRRHRLRCE